MVTRDSVRASGISSDPKKEKKSKSGGTVIADPAPGPA
jgi:hypothetical protein